MQRERIVSTPEGKGAIRKSASDGSPTPPKLRNQLQSAEDQDPASGDYEEDEASEEMSSLCEEDTEESEVENNVSEDDCQTDVENENSEEDELEADDDADDKEVKNIRKAYTVIVDQKTAFGGCTETYKISIEPLKKLSDIRIFFEYTEKDINAILDTTLKKLRQAKFIFVLHGSINDNEYNNFEIMNNIVFNSSNNKRSNYESVISTLISELDTFKREQNVADVQFFHLEIQVLKISEINNSFIALPSHLERDIVNVRSTDNLSFQWAVLAALHPEIDPATLEEFSDQLDLEDIQHPVKFEDIPMIEELNDISFNVFVLKHSSEKDADIIEGPVYHTKHRREKHINLLLLYDENKRHYCYIENLGRVVDPSNKGIICDGCLNFFVDEHALIRHQELICLRIRTDLSRKSQSFIRFDKKDQHVPVPIVVYADFEAMLQPVKKKSLIKNKKPGDTYSINVSKHVPYSFAFYVKCYANDTLSCLKTYHGLDCEDKFLKMLKEILESICNKLKNITFIPVFFHNLTNYDGHFVVKGIFSEPGGTTGLGTKHNLTAIYKKIKLNGKCIQLKFLDSLSFLKAPLESLARNLSLDQFRESRRFWLVEYPHLTDEKTFRLLTEKGIFPYEYITSLDILEEQSLPGKEKFYDNLKARHVSDDDYKRAKKVWKLLKCKNISDYAKFYLQMDVLILADIFENFRRTCLNTYKLDPARYYSISSVSWEAMLKVTKVELELLRDVDMLVFLKRGLRGGLAQCNRRHAVANNKYMPTSYDEEQKDSYLMYYDANNLYGWAMSQPLPYKGFRWRDTDVDFDVPANSDVGYFLEVDLAYPDDKEIHNWHEDFPFCPESKSVSDVNDERLITDLLPKKNYVLHHSYLIQCLKNGLVLEKIHRVLEFEQKPWLKPYIDMNTQRRAAATSDAEKDFYKLMNNSIFGKTIRNIDKDVDIKIVGHWPGDKYKRGANYYLGTPEYHSHDIISDNLITVELNKTKRVYDTPVYVGYSILDLAKARMYDFHYGFMKKKFENNAKLLYTDTDSLIYQFFTEDYYAEMKDSLDDHFDTSNYPEDNQFGFPCANKMRVGYFKDEFKGAVVKEFVALRPKVYMLQAEDKTVKRAAMGAPKDVSDNFTIDDYRRCLVDKKPLYKEMYRIRAVEHDVYTQRVRKVVLSPRADAKRQWLPNGIDSLPFGHYRLRASSTHAAPASEPCCSKEGV